MPKMKNRFNMGELKKKSEQKFSGVVFENFRGFC